LRPESVLDFLPAVAHEALEIGRGLRIPGDEIVETASRSRGPGGQNVNKTETRVTLHWSLRESRALSPEQRGRLLEAFAGRLTREGELVVRSDRARTRPRNRALARERLAELVRAALTPRTPRTKTRPTRASKERRLTGKRQQSERKRARTRVRERDA
jgi:ribosome-associated protein